ncbi:MAG TPA: hypothetical protein VK196_06140 [Magnetospirillum sp.]|nr:hypothetical protein [Magnetospirillum sp.]
MELELNDVMIGVDALSGYLDLNDVPEPFDWDEFNFRLATMRPTGFPPSTRLAD